MGCGHDRGFPLPPGLPCAPPLPPRGEGMGVGGRLPEGPPMIDLPPDAGQHMAREIAEAPGVLAAAVAQGVALPDLGPLRAIYTIARGSSDAAANILSYEIMRETGASRHLAAALGLFAGARGAARGRGGAGRVAIGGVGGSGPVGPGCPRVGRAGAGAGERGRQPVEAAAEVDAAHHGRAGTGGSGDEIGGGRIGGGMALLSAIVPGYAARAQAGAAAVAAAGREKRCGRSARSWPHSCGRAMSMSIGRDCGFGAAQELALKLKECCALHAEAYSSSEVLHGPLSWPPTRS